MRFMWGYAYKHNLFLYLSILFMRFFKFNFLPVSFKIDFQFSLWDSPGFLGKNMKEYKLSILFMRFCIQPSWLDSVLNFFQFSLWDSWCRQDMGKCYFSRLSILFMRFSKIRLKLMRKNLYILSILFMRFLHWPIHFRMLFCLSILFMRFTKNMLWFSIFHNSFNSLYEILKLHFLQTHQRVQPFNSLYEIPYYVSFWYFYFILNFQFSLWDSNDEYKMYIGYDIAFNSLYEILSV